MSADTHTTKPKVRRLDKIRTVVLRPAASVRPPETPADTPAEPTPRKDLGDGRVPGTEARALLEAEADQLTNVAPGTFLYGILTGYFGTALDKFSFVVFMQKLVEKMAPADPLEAMLVEQIALAHHALGRAQVRAANAQNADAAKIFYSAAARLQAEFRQSLLALKAYRAPRTSEAVQGSTSSGVTRPTETAEVPHPATFGDSKLGSNRNRLTEVLDELSALT